MLIFIKTKEGKSFPIDVDLENDSVLDAKKKIAEHESVAFSHVVLIYAGKKLSDKRKLKDCGISMEATVHMLIQKPKIVCEAKSTPSVSSTASPVPLSNKQIPNAEETKKNLIENFMSGMQSSNIEGFFEGLLFLALTPANSCF